MKLDRDSLLSLHRELVAIPSVSHAETAIADFVCRYLRDHGVAVERLGDNVMARAGAGRQILFNSHLDTVPAQDGWTRSPWVVTREAGRVYGLGANDAKASCAAMLAAFLNNHHEGGPCELMLLLVPEEETGGKGTEMAWPHAKRQGFMPEGVVVGEPTNLDIARAQKGLLVLEMTAEGDACHSANAQALHARNAVRTLARDLVALEGLAIGDHHPLLGFTTCEPTMISGSERRNMLPAKAVAWLDLRTVPGVAADSIVGLVQSRIEGKIRLHSSRLGPRETSESEAIVEAASRARPSARIYGSRTMSDMVYFHDVPAIKCGPGRSERSHTPDEFVQEDEIVDGYQFYVDLLHQFAGVAP